MGEGVLGIGDGDGVAMGVGLGEGAWAYTGVACGVVLTNKYRVIKKPVAKPSRKCAGLKFTGQLYAIIFFVAKAKYKEYVARMLEAESELFDKFREAHENYILDPHSWQEKFNEIGGRVMETVRDYEDKLCRQSEVAGYGNYTNTLSEKFNDELRKIFPKIDSVGIIMKKPEPAPAQEAEFEIKKIDLG